MLHLEDKMKVVRMEIKEAKEIKRWTWRNGYQW
jgi:hypothetical protein